jgi:hypothetical protein
LLIPKAFGKRQLFIVNSFPTFATSHFFSKIYATLFFLSFVLLLIPKAFGKRQLFIVNSFPTFATSHLFHSALRIYFISHLLLPFLRNHYQNYME